MKTPFGTIVTGDKASAQLEEAGLFGQPISGIALETSGDYFILASNVTITVGQELMYTAAYSSAVLIHVTLNTGCASTLNVVGGGTVYSTQQLH